MTGAASVEFERVRPDPRLMRNVLNLPLTTAIELRQPVVFEAGN
jgi:hypothetical protein